MYDVRPETFSAAMRGASVLPGEFGALVWQTFMRNRAVMAAIASQDPEIRANMTLGVQRFGDMSFSAS
jgi:hypothetical protein